MEENRQILSFIRRCEDDLQTAFSEIDRNEETAFSRVMEAFQEERVAVRHFSGTTGYGYDDDGRDTLERVFARVFHMEKALVRPSIASGTHALCVMLFGLLRPGELLLSVSGEPYDTLRQIILPSQKGEEGSLADYGVAYQKQDLTQEGLIDYEALEIALRNPSLRVAALQRSRGYGWRASFSTEQINACADFIHEKRPDVYVALDNCYGEFVDSILDDLHVDIMAGSLIKNPGGGLAATGGYVVGKEALVNRCAKRLIAPGVGGEVGSYEMGYRMFYQGLWMAPHTVAQAVKVALLFASAFEKCGFSVNPTPNESRHDIIQAIRLGQPEKVIAFCKAVQAASPIDSYVSPEPWDMPGYEDPVIMAAGTFVSGSSLEMSADAPMRAPYIVYLQGGLTYTHGKYTLQRILTDFMEKNLLSIEDLERI